MSRREVFLVAGRRPISTFSELGRWVELESDSPSGDSEARTLLHARCSSEMDFLSNREREQMGKAREAEEVMHLRKSRNSDPKVS